MSKLQPILIFLSWMSSLTSPLGKNIDITPPTQIAEELETQGQRVARIQDNNQGWVLILDDSSGWEVDPGDQPKSSTWRPGDVIIVIEMWPSNQAYPHTLKHAKSQSRVQAREWEYEQ